VSDEFSNTGVLTLFHDAFSIERQRSIMVVGVERGGTSMVAGVLRSLGVCMGTRTGRNHENPAFQFDNPDILQKQIELMNAEYDVWGFKYPRASLMIDFYNEHLRNPYYILVTRNIASVVDSWCSRGQNDPVETALHAIEYYSVALHAIKSSLRPSLMVNYELACKYPVAFIEAAAKFVGVELTEDRKQKSLQMITGDGGGYLNIPEHNFHISNVDSISEDVELVFVEKEYVSFVGKVGEVDKEVFGLACSREHKVAFPKELYLDIKADPNQKYSEVRLYIDFGEGFFSRHSYQLELCGGLNHYRLVMNGNVFTVCVACQNKAMKEGLQISIYDKGSNM